MNPDGSQFLQQKNTEYEPEESAVMIWRDTVTSEQIDTTPYPDGFSLFFTAVPSPNGNYLALEASDPNGELGGENYTVIPVVDRQGNDVLIDDPETNPFIAGVYGGKVWSAQGELYFAAISPDDQTPRLARLNADLRTFEEIIEFSSDDDEPRDLAVSPDGSQVVYTYLNHLWRLDVASGQHVQLTTSGLFETDATFSPDGRHIAFLHEGSVFIIPNGEYPEPVEIILYEPDEVPDDAGFDIVGNADGGTILPKPGGALHWFATP